VLLPSLPDGLAGHPEPFHDSTEHAASSLNGLLMMIRREKAWFLDYHRYFL
jgi:hypothetical protein